MPSGFEEKPQAAYDAGTPAVGYGRAVEAGRAKVKLGPGGRIVIPAAMREALGVEEGDSLVVTLTADGSLLVTSMASAVRQAQAMVRAVVPAGTSLVDELIADRRREEAEERAR